MLSRKIIKFYGLTISGFFMILLVEKVISRICLGVIYCFSLFVYSILFKLRCNGDNQNKINTGVFMIFIYIISSAWWYFICSVIYAKVHHHHHHHFSLHPSHCWAQTSSQNERPRAVVMRIGHFTQTV